MLFTSLSYRWVGETAEHRVNYDEELGKTRLLGMMDDNVDGKLEKAELKGNIGQQLATYFDMLDKNHDGGQARRRRAGRRAGGMMGQRRSAAAPPSAAPKASASPIAGGK